VPPPRKRLSSNVSIESDAVRVLTSDVSPRVTSDRELAFFNGYRKERPNSCSVKRTLHRKTSLDQFPYPKKINVTVRQLAPLKVR
jgi:hypothetical protein